MINRANWLDVNRYLGYCAKTLQNDPKTVLKRRSSLRHLLEWADDTLLGKARLIDPTFPAYLGTARGDGREGPLAPATLAKICESARMFFEWARREFPARYKLVTESWIASLRPSRARGAQSELKQHDFYSLEDVLKVARLETSTLRERRDQAAFVFLFLSGMRVDAFVSLPVSCVDLGRMQVRQLPAQGVRTKNHKAAVTTLLNIGELVGVVRGWDELVRQGEQVGRAWFAQIDRDGVSFGPNQAPGAGRRIILGRGMKGLCARAGVGYLSPHKLRHGHALYALKQAKNMAQLKAVSQNLMHANISTTDGLYAILSGDDVHDIITGLGGEREEQTEQRPPAALLAELLREIRGNPDLLGMVLGTR